jgi:hypothetical protein
VVNPILLGGGVGQSLAFTPNRLIAIRRKSPLTLLKINGGIITSIERFWIPLAALGSVLTIATAFTVLGTPACCDRAIGKNYAITNFSTACEAALSRDRQKRFGVFSQNSAELSMIGAIENKPFFNL